jgi:hypothetical protein
MKDFVSGGVSRASALVGSFALLGLACVMALPYGVPGLALGGAVFSLLGVFWMGKNAGALAHLLAEAHQEPAFAAALPRRVDAPRDRRGMSPGSGRR